MGASAFVRYKCHSLLHLWLVSNKLTKKTIWDINGMTDILDAGAVKVNLGSIPDEDALLNYIELPKTQLTSSQYGALLDWLDFAQHNGIDSIEVNTYNQGRYKSYSLIDNTSDEIVAKIKRYYASGNLYEDVVDQLNKSHLSISLNEDIESVRKNFPNISDEDFNRLIRLDPTFKDGRNSVGTYGKWILSLFQKGKLSNEGHVKDALTRFE